MRTLEELEQEVRRGLGRRPATVENLVGIKRHMDKYQKDLAAVWDTYDYDATARGESLLVNVFWGINNPKAPTAAQELNAYEDAQRLADCAGVSEYEVNRHIKGLD